MSNYIDEVELVFEDFNERLQKTFANYKSELATVRAGRANPHILDKVVVDYYGTPTPIQNMANVSVPEARLLVISPWDKSQLKAITKAINAANIGLVPTDDGRVIRIVFPELTEERRRDTLKTVKGMVEEAKIVMRNARRDALDEFKKLQKASTITEDELKTYTAEVDKGLARSIDDVDKSFKEKEQEIMTV